MLLYTKCISNMFIEDATCEHLLAMCVHVQRLPPVGCQQLRCHDKNWPIFFLAYHCHLALPVTSHNRFVAPLPNTSWDH